ncbi:RCC1 domain-containing protein [Methanocella arvoryzae]|uniref:Predicted regulator of chromosome condensation n=1 Tax=Methanocella arvoryzae (strain DSM 22066 / NBRC 105507 / MRE50) TaxID=351160 RepID=Q0W3S6_METAR|nr:regulator of chromosome condensation [Methanocella arvoryzae]CAJ36967.1 predicted regulator of chromosome condensation [Methanocella arvoryzae MRE50]
MVALWWKKLALVLVLGTLLLSPAMAAVTDTPPAAAYLGDGCGFMIKNDGSLWAWGNNNNGQLGDGTYINRLVPVLIKDYTDLLGGNLIGISSIDGGYGYTVILRNDGTVWTSGNNDAGQLGQRNRADNAVFTQIPNMSNVARIDAGEGHVLALKVDGTVWSWGDNSFGQLGNGSKALTGEPARVMGVQGIRSIAAGGRHSIATYGMEAYAWGDNLFGQLGDGTYNSSNTPVKVRINEVTDVAAGEYHSLALLEDGTVWAWGGNDYGQLGDGIPNNSLVPVKCGNLRNVKTIAASDRYSLALKYDGTVWAWGYNGNGVLGTGSADNERHPEPVQVKGLYDIKKIYAAPTGCMAIDTYGNVWVWGMNQFGQLGDGTKTDRYSPVPWFPSMAPWWYPATPTPVPATPTPTPTPVPTPVPAPSPGITLLMAAILGAYLIAGRR